MYHYLVHGLQVESALACPELPAAQPGQGPADISIRYGETPPTLTNPTKQSVLYQAKPNQFLLNLDHIARYLVQDGKEIIIQPAPESHADEIRLFLLGSAFGALLHQRGRLVLHGSAIATAKGAVCFVGMSGVGKSTLAAAFQQRGYRVLSDDLCTVGFDSEGAPLVFPSCTHLKLWTDAAKKLAHDPNTARRVRPQLDKYAFYHHAQFDPTPVPLHALYTLQIVNTPELQLKRVEGFEKVHTLVNHTYRKRFLIGLGMRAVHFQQATRIAPQIKIGNVTRPLTPFLLDELVELIAGDLRHG